MVIKFIQKELHEINQGHIYQHSLNSNTGIITAYRGELDVPTNEKRNSDLETMIRSSGFGYITVAGFYTENPGRDNERKVQEKSFVITSNKLDGGKLRNFLIKMGGQYNQDSVLYKDASTADAVLIGTTHGRWPGKHTEVSAGKFSVKNIGECYIKMRNYKTFVFESAKPPSISS